MKGYEGEFLGFTYNGVHSSVLGITRTQKGMINSVLNPTISDVTAVATGRDGTLYYGQNYTQRKLSINFSFYRISELQLNYIGKLFNDSGIGELIFDESPHKVYSAKVTGKVSLKHICFENDEGKREYNGEGTVSFICYFPFARSRFSYLEQYTINNIAEWIPHDIKDDYINLDTYQTVTEEKYGHTVFSLKNALQFARADTPRETDLEQIFGVENVTISDLYESSLNPYCGSLETYTTDAAIDWIDANEVPSLQEYGIWNVKGDSYCECTLKNTGDIEAMMGIWIALPNSSSKVFNVEVNGYIKDECQQFRLNNVQNTYEEDFIYIDCFYGTIFGYKLIGDELVRTNTLYNTHMTGSFLFFYPDEIMNLTISTENITINEIVPKLDLNYLYL